MSGGPLQAADVHVWRASLDVERGVVERMHALLSEDERDHAARYRFARDRDRYVVGRGVLRTLLARELGTGAREIRFRYGAYGKPGLPEDCPQFNVSHSGSLALFAFSPRFEVGVDVEQARPDFEHEGIAERFFSRAEVDAVRSLPPRLQPHAFLRCWTRKEAFIKATGDGLTLPLDSFDVSLDPRRPALLRTAWSVEEPQEWSLVDLSDHAQSYVAALAVRSPSCRVVTRDWPGGDDPTTNGETT